MQQFTTNSIVSVACSTAIWFGIKAVCRFFFTRYSTAFRNGLVPESATKQQQLPATASKQQREQQDPERNKRRFLTYVVSTINALSSGIGALALMKASNWSPWGDVEILATGTRLILISMLGYFTSDLVAIAPGWSKHKDEMLHHLVAIFLLSVAFSLPDYTSWAPFIMVTELSTPFINVQTLMVKLGYPDNHPVPNLSLKLFAAAFILLRIVYLPVAVYHLVFDARLNPGGHFESHVHKAISAVVIALQILNVWWLFGALKKLRSGGVKQTRDLVKDE